jgi:hypothetical protein
LPSASTPRPIAVGGSNNLPQKAYQWLTQFQLPQIIPRRLLINPQVKLTNNSKNMVKNIALHRFVMQPGGVAAKSVNLQWDTGGA